MRIELGNDQPSYNPTGGPVVTYANIPDTYTLDASADVNELGEHLASTDMSNFSQLPDQEAFVAVTHPGAGIWVNHAVAGTKPSWVWSDNEDMAQMLSEHYGCPIGRPEDVEETHYTTAGPAGVTPQLSIVPDLEEGESD